MTEAVGEGDWPAQKRSEKVKQLENKIKKLEKENKKLLHKVHNSPSPDRTRKALNSNAGIHNGISVDDGDDLENGLLDLQTLINEDDFREDEWLYVSPKLPPTPIQRKVTPHEWLSEGRSKEGTAGQDIPSIDDVRKSLVYNIDEAENLGDMPSYNQTSSLKRRPAAGNRASQRAEDQLKQGTGPSSMQRRSSLPSDDEEAAVPVVKWKAKLPADEPSSLSLQSEPSKEDAVPARKWKVKQVPATRDGFDENHHHLEMAAEESIRSSPQQGRHRSRIAQKQDQEGGVEEVPVVKWKAKMPDEGSPSDVPVVKWKAKAPPQETVATDVPVVKGAKIPQGSADVPVVKWKAKVPEDGEAPVMRRKARMPEDVTSSDVPVVKWKAKVPEDDKAPVMRRKTRMPEDVTSSDVPVVKWKAKAPEDGNVTAARRIAKMPEDVQTSDVVPVVQWKAKVPEDAQWSEAVVRRKARMPQETPNSEVPVVKWQTKVPEDGQPSNSPFAMRKKAKVPEDHMAQDVPVVKWKAKMPRDGQPSNNSPATKKKAKMPEDPEVPVVKCKAKMPPANSEASEVPVANWKASNHAGNVESLNPQGQKRLLQQSQKGARSPRKVARMPDDDIVLQSGEDVQALHSNSHQTMSSATMPGDIEDVQAPHSNSHHTMSSATMPGDIEDVQALHSNSHHTMSSATMPGDIEDVQALHSNSHQTMSSAGMPDDIATQSSEDVQALHSNSHQTVSSSSPSHSPVTSSTQLPQSEPVAKSLSRRSSFSESRSPSPPSISPHVRMAIASPILSRRTPSPSRGLAGSIGSLNSRQSPNASPVPHRKHLHYISSGQQSPATNRAFAGGPSPISGDHVSRIRTPRSQQSGMVNTSSPMKGLTPPGERKHRRRMLPSGPGRSHDQGTADRHRQVSPGQDTGEDDSWLEGCF